MFAQHPYQKSFVKLFQKFAQVKGRVALVARRNERNPLFGVFLFWSFFLLRLLHQKKKGQWALSNYLQMKIYCNAYLYIPI